MDGVTVVELDMVNMRIYFPLCAVSGFSIRTLLYPFNLIKTRMQVQRHHSLYSSLPDAFSKIMRNEGLKGLYRGFWINNLTIFSQIYYIGAYEMTRTFLSSSTNPKLRSFLAGGFASVVGQTTVLPIDIVSQHLQVYNLHLSKQKLSSQPLKQTQFYNSTSNSPQSQNLQPSHSINKKSTFNPYLTNPHQPSHPHQPSYPQTSHPRMSKRAHLNLTMTICRDLYKRGGLRAFYKGYWTSLFTYAPSSALWWLSYDVYCTELDRKLPEHLPRLLIQVLAAPLGGATTTIVMTPMDAVRARIQIENTTFMQTCRSLWAEERWGVLRKGLSARLIQSIFFSTLTMLSYESIKRFSLLPQYQGSVRW